MIAQIVVDPEGNMYLDSLDVQFNFTLTIMLRQHGTIVRTNLRCVQAHELGQITPYEGIRFKVYDGGSVAIQCDNPDPTPVIVTFNDRSPIQYTIEREQVIGTLDITR